MQPAGADGFPTALAKPKELAHRALAPGESFTAGPLKIKLSRAVMPAFVGAETGEAVVDGDVSVVGTDKSASLHLPATIRIATYRVRFDDVGKTAGTSFDVVAEDLGCEGEPHGKSLAKGDAMTVWLSTEGVDQFELFAGDDDFN